MLEKKIIIKPSKSEKEISTEERLENAIKNRPDNYYVERDSDGRLMKVQDFDSGVFHIRYIDDDGKEAWGWIS